MTTWLPTLNPERPRYISIADSIAADLAAGKLTTGDRLPPQRELAWRLGVTVGTVTRAYQEAERRGLLVGEVGRGSYLRDPAGSRAVLPGLARGEPGILEMHIASPRPARERLRCGPHGPHDRPAPLQPPRLRAGLRRAGTSGHGSDVAQTV